MANQEFNEIQKELGEDQSLLFEILSDPAAYNKSTGGRVGQGGPFPNSVSQTMRTLLPDWSDVRIQAAIKALESKGLIKGLYSHYNVMCTDRGIRLLQNWLTEKGKEYADWVGLTLEGTPLR